MKKRFYIFIIFLCNYLVYANPWNNCFFNSFDNYNVETKIQYVALKDTDIVRSNGKTTNEILKKNEIITNVNYSCSWGNDNENNIIYYTLIYAFQYNNLFYLEDDFYIKGSDCLPDNITIKSRLGNKNNIWIPVFYREILQEDSLIKANEKYIPNVKNLCSETDDPWYCVKNFSIPINFSFRNTRMTIKYNYDSCSFLFTNVKKINDNAYEIECVNQNSSGFDELNNIDFLTPFYKSKLKIKLVIDNNIIRLYENNKLLIELISVSSDWVNKYQQNLLKYNRNEIQSLLTELNNSKSINDVVYCTNCNLKLRSGEATSTQVLTVMSAGTKVKILELGKAETIDGINSNWVKVEVQSGAKDRDGKEIKAGTVGWCYGGYLQ